MNMCVFVPLCIVLLLIFFAAATAQHYYYIIEIINFFYLKYYIRTLLVLVTIECATGVHSNSCSTNTFVLESTHLHCNLQLLGCLTFTTYNSSLTT